MDDYEPINENDDLAQSILKMFKTVSQCLHYQDNLIKCLFVMQIGTWLIMYYLFLTR